MSDIIVIDRELKVKMLEALKRGFFEQGEFKELAGKEITIVTIEAPHNTLRISRSLAGGLQMSEKEYIEYLESVVNGEQKQPDSFIRELSEAQKKENDRYLSFLDAYEKREKAVLTIKTKEPEGVVRLYNKLSKEK